MPEGISLTKIMFEIGIKGFEKHQRYLKVLENRCKVLLAQMLDKETLG